MRRHPIREGVTSMSVAVGEQTVWLGCRQCAGPGLPPFLHLWKWGSQGRITNTQNDQRMDGTANPAAIPEHCRGEGMEAGTELPQLWERPKAITVSLTTPASPPQAPAQLLSSPNPFAKQSRTSPPFPWGIEAEATQCPIPIQDQDMVLLPGH